MHRVLHPKPTVEPSKLQCWWLPWEMHGIREFGVHPIMSEVMSKTHNVVNKRRFDDGGWWRGGRSKWQSWGVRSRLVSSIMLRQVWLCSRSMARPGVSWPCTLKILWWCKASCEELQDQGGSKSQERQECCEWTSSHPWEASFVQIKELKSFFENQVWEFQTTKQVLSERIMSVKILTHWKKNPDGTRRAKTRLIVRVHRFRRSWRTSWNFKSHHLTIVKVYVAFVGCHYAVEYMGSWCLCGISPEPLTESQVVGEVAKWSTSFVGCRWEQENAAGEAVLQPDWHFSWLVPGGSWQVVEERPEAACSLPLLFPHLWEFETLWGCRQHIFNGCSVLVPASCAEWWSCTLMICLELDAPPHLKRLSQDDRGLDEQFHVSWVEGGWQPRILWMWVGEDWVQRPEVVSREVYEEGSSCHSWSQARSSWTPSWEWSHTTPWALAKPAMAQCPVEPSPTVFHFVACSENSAICVEEEDEEEADPDAFVPVSTDDCLNMDEQPSEGNAPSREDDVTIASSEGSAIEEQLNERIEPLPQYTWLPPQHEWEADPTNIYQSTNFFDAEIHPELKRWQPVPSPFSLDANHPLVQYGDTRFIGHQTTSYPPATTRDQLPWPDLIQAVLQHKNTFDCNNTIYLRVDNRQPGEVPHWPPFCSWWTSRRELKGLAEEATDIVWITATEQLDTVPYPYYWTGPLLLCIARWLFPACHLALIDNDCVPLALFEVIDLIKLSQQLPDWRTLIEGHDDSPPQIGMLLVTEPHFERNAGLVISPASDLFAPDLSAPIAKLSEQFQACLVDFLNTSQPPSNPTAAATSGLLHTPLLGVRCSDSLHHCLAWAILGIYMIHTMWPPPRRHAGQKWPAHSCSLSLTPTAQERNPPITMWARASFEQGCLAILPSMEGFSRVVTLSGDQLFQAAHLPNPTQDMRPPILHAYGPNKETAPTTLAQLAQEGWETLLPTLYGAHNKPAPWHIGTWTPVGGIAIKGTAAPAAISQDLRAALGLLWHRTARPGPLPLWMVDTFAGPLLPHEAAPIYNSHPSNAQAMALEKALLDIPVREHSRFVTTAIPLCQAHNHPIIERLLAAQTFPQVVLQRPVPPEADAILSLPPRLRKLIISKILHRFATVGAKDALQVDCPGLSSDSLDLLPNPDLTVCCHAVGNTQVYGPTLTPIDMLTHNGHVVAYGDTSGIHEMTVALLGIDNNAFRWEKLGLGGANEIINGALLILQQAQRLPAHRRPPHAFVISACSLKLSLFHPQSQRHWLHVLHDAYTSPLEDNRTVQLRGFSAGSYTAAVIALILNIANQLTPWQIRLSIGAYAGPVTVLTALCAKAVTRQICTSIVHLQADQLCLWGTTDISCFQLPPHFVLCYITGQPRWMRAPYHNYTHLLSVHLPAGVHDAHQLVLDIADLIPYKRRLGTPLRLITWMRMRTMDLEGSSRNTVAALKSSDPVQQLLQRYGATTEAEAKEALFAQFELTPCDNTEPIPPALCQWLKELVQSHLQGLPLLELSTLISLFLPQIPRESLRTRNLRSLHPPADILPFARLHDGLGGMDHYQLTLSGWPPPLIFVPSNTDLPWSEWLSESNNFKQIQFGVTIGEILCLCIEPHLVHDPEPWAQQLDPLPPNHLYLLLLSLRPTPELRNPNLIKRMRTKLYVAPTIVVLN